MILVKAISLTFSGVEDSGPKRDGYGETGGRRESRVPIRPRARHWQLSVASPPVRPKVRGPNDATDDGPRELSATRFTKRQLAAGQYMRTVAARCSVLTLVMQVCARRPWPWPWVARAVDLPHAAGGALGRSATTRRIGPTARSRRPVRVATRLASSETLPSNLDRSALSTTAQHRSPPSKRPGRHSFQRSCRLLSSPPSSTAALFASFPDLPRELVRTSPAPFHTRTRPTRVLRASEPPSARYRQCSPISVVHTSLRLLTFTGCRLSVPS